MTVKKKRSASAIRTERNVNKYREAGLIQAKVWVHPLEAAATRSYATKKPLTKAILATLR